MAITRAISNVPVLGIDTSFDVTKGFVMDMGMFPDDAPYRGYVSLIVIQLSAISGATNLTIRICRDAAGDEMIITDTTSQIFTGITTATKGTACYALNAFAGLAETDRLHVFCKTNAGSLTADFCEITWGEI